MRKIAVTLAVILSLATIAFVGAMPTPAATVSIKTANYAVQLTDDGATFVMNSASALSIYLLSLPSDRVGFTITVQKRGAGNVTVVPQAADYIADSGAGQYIRNTTAAETYASITLMYTQVNRWQVISAFGTWSTNVSTFVYGPVLPASIANGGTGATTAANARAYLGLMIGSDVQAFIPAGTSAYFYDGTKAWHALNQAAVTGLTINDSPNFHGLTIGSQYAYRAGGTDVPITDGGTGASTVANARTFLGLAIGTNVQAYNSNLTGINQDVSVTGSPSFAGLTLGTYTGAWKASAGVFTRGATYSDVNANPFITAGSNYQYYRGDKTWQTLTQAAVSGLTTASSPTFAGLTAGTMTGVAKLTSGVLGIGVTYSDVGAAATVHGHESFDALTIGTSGGLLKYAVTGLLATNATAAVIGTNCPAIDVTRVYKWLPVKLADGTTVYMPVWK